MSNQIQIDFIHCGSAIAEGGASAERPGRGRCLKCKASLILYPKASCGGYKREVGCIRVYDR